MCMLAKIWDEKTDPTGWYVSEKLDGMRAIWTGSGFVSRLGNKIECPAWFSSPLPADVKLDGELWCGRKKFEECVSIVKRYKDTDVQNWKKIKYVIFDCPSHKGNYVERMLFLESQVFNKIGKTDHIKLIPRIKCLGADHLSRLMEEGIKKGYEGLMLNDPTTKYERKRSKGLLKFKRFLTGEALVKNKVKGKGRCTNMLGKLQCILPNGTSFGIGTGFSDAERVRPPKVGAVVEFKYQELSKKGVPRFPVFLRVRSDLSWEDVLKSYGADHIEKKTQDIDEDEAQDTGSERGSDKDEDKDEDKDNSDQNKGDNTEDEGKDQDDDQDQDQDQSKHQNDKVPERNRKPCRYGQTCRSIHRPWHTRQFSHPGGSVTRLQISTSDLEKWVKECEHNAISVPWFFRLRSLD